MKRKARILACMLALALVASAAGCSGAGDTDSKTNPSGTTQSGTNNSEWAGKELVVTSFMDLTFARMALDALKEGAGSEPDVPTDPVETGASTLPVVVCAVLVVLAAGMLVVSKRKAHA